MLSISVSRGQDVAFTQYYAAPLLLNPALTGSNQGKFRLTGINRDQWGTVLDNSFETFAGSVDVRFKGGFGIRTTGDFIGAGISFFKDKVTGVDFSTTNMSFYGAYHKLLDGGSKQYLSAGIALTIATQNVNSDQFFFGDEFNGTTGYDLQGRENENPFINNITYGDLAVGVNYTISPNRQYSYFLGAAIHHAMEPDNTFYEDEDFPGDSQVPRKYTLYGSIIYRSTANFWIIPRVILTAQAKQNNLIIGSNLRFGVKDSAGTALYAGAWARPSFNVDGNNLDAVTLMAGIQLRSLIIGTSYDLHISDFNNQVATRGAFELSVSYVGESEDEDVLCPVF